MTSAEICVQNWANVFQNFKIILGFTKLLILVSLVAIIFLLVIPGKEKVSHRHSAILQRLIPTATVSV